MSVDPAPIDRLSGSVDRALRADPDRTLGYAARAVRFVSFWIASLLPFAYLPLVATGTVEQYPVAFGALVCCNAVAFVLGHGYRDDARPV